MEGKSEKSKIFREGESQFWRKGGNGGKTWRYWRKGNLSCYWPMRFGFCRSIGFGDMEGNVRKGGEKK